MDSRPVDKLDPTTKVIKHHLEKYLRDYGKQMGHSKSRALANKWLAEINKAIENKNKTGNDRVLLTTHEAMLEIISSDTRTLAPTIFATIYVSSEERRKIIIESTERALREARTKSSAFFGNRDINETLENLRNSLKIVKGEKALEPGRSLDSHLKFLVTSLERNHYFQYKDSSENLSSLFPRSDYLQSGLTEHIFTKLQQNINNLKNEPKSFEEIKNILLKFVENKDAENRKPANKVPASYIEAFSKLPAAIAEAKTPEALNAIINGALRDPNLSERGFTHSDPTQVASSLNLMLIRASKGLDVILELKAKQSPVKLAEEQQIPLQEPPRLR